MTVGDYPLERRPGARRAGEPRRLLRPGRRLRLADAARARRAARRGRVRHVRRAVPDDHPQPAGRPGRHRHLARARRSRWSAGSCWVSAPAWARRPSGWPAAVVAALVIYLLAWRRGTTGYRIILVGIGVSWMCTSATGYLLARAKLHEAQQVVGWMVGNLNDVTWSQTAPLAARAGGAGAGRARAERVAADAAPGRRRGGRAGHAGAAGAARAAARRRSGWWRSARRPRGRWRSSR